MRLPVEFPRAASSSKTTGARRARQKDLWTRSVPGLDESPTAPSMRAWRPEDVDLLRQRQVIETLGGPERSEQSRR